MSIQKISSMSVLVGSALAALFAACARDEGQSSSDTLASTEANITATQESQDTAHAAAKACFDTYKTCQASAAAGDTSCKDALKACLPEQPPAPVGGQCGGHDDSDAGDDDSDDDSDEATDEGTRTGDAGARPERGDAGTRDGRKDRGRGGPGARSGHCGGHVDLPSGALGGCRDRAAAATDPAAAQAAHQACLANAFADKIAELCAKATALCAQPNAPTDVCTRVQTACANAATADAGN